MEWGMANRLSQLIQSDGHALFLPVDHGYFQGPTTKLEEPRLTIEPLLPYADALFITRGVLRSSVDPDNSRPAILRVSGGTSVVGKDLANEGTSPNKRLALRYIQHRRTSIGLLPEPGLVDNRPTRRPDR